MPRQKLIRRDKLKKHTNVFDAPEQMAGKWASFFGNSNPIILEIACGKAHFSCGHAQMYPKKNVIAVDKKSDRIYVGVKNAEENESSNIAFVRGIVDKIDKFFAPHEVSEIWITFPDPHPKKNKSNKRLTHHRFLKQYENILKPRGILHLKTDYEPLLDWSMESLHNENWCIKKVIKDIYASKPSKVLQIQTDYEKRHLADNRKIHYISAYK